MLVRRRAILLPMNSNAQHTNAGTTQTAAHPVVGRFAPSPSGRMHLGNVYSALVAWLSVRSQNGRMVLRIEDLDERCRRGKFDEQLIADLRWLGLDWDEGPYYQSDRLDLYRDAVRALASQDLVYPCFCTRAELHAASAPHREDGQVIYPGTCRRLSPEEAAERARRTGRPPALRLRVPEEEITFTDGHMGTYGEDLPRDCGDFLLRRSDGMFAYQLAVVVDDAAMGVTQVVRGSDLLDSTPRQIWLQEELGLPHPEYGHVPLLLAPDGRRLAKRDRDQELGALQSCYSAQELVGQLALLAGLITEYAPISPAELIPLFSWEKLPQADCAVHWADGICTFFTKTIQSPVQRDRPPV